ncbi:hypothetical protein GCM10022206_16830 [Streptomyces chiangmaiensis]
MKQVHAELGLELADLLGQRRLGHVQPLRGAAEVTLLGDSDEVPEVPEIHMQTVLIGRDICTSQYQEAALTSVP